MVAIGRRNFGPGWRPAICLLVCLLAVLTGCWERDPPSPQPNVNLEEPRWIYRHEPQPAKIAVVFVHGLFGSTLDTWTNAQGQSLFQYLHERDDIGPKVDIFAFGFTSNMLEGGSLNIRQAAGKLDEVLRFEQVWNYDTVVFVTHSMGGLVVMQELINHPRRLQQVPLLMMYAVPQEGTQISAIGAKLLNNPALRQMVPANGSEFLQGLDDSWGLLPRERRPRVICAYETKATYGIPIVGQTSATRYCDGAKMAIGGADHISIAKPYGPKHDSVIKLVNALNDYVLGTPRDPLLAMPDFVEEDGVLVYRMNRPFEENTARLVNAGPSTIHYTLGLPSNPKLMVAPTETPRDIPIEHTEQLRFNLLLRGDWEPEYRFTLETRTMPARTVVVRLPQPEDGAQQSAAVVEGVAGDVAEFLSVPANVEALKALSPEAQQQRVVEIAKGSLDRQLPGLSDDVALVMTADALSTAGWSDLATSALRLAERDAPAALDTPGAQLLASAISAQSGETKIFRERATPPPPPADLKGFKTQTHVIDQANLDTWSKLATRMQQVPALKSSGLGLQGDVLRERGEFDAAKAAYRDASVIRATPELSRKIQTIQRVQPIQQPP